MFTLIVKHFQLTSQNFVTVGWTWLDCMHKLGKLGEKYAFTKEIQKKFRHRKLTSKRDLRKKADSLLKTDKNIQTAGKFSKLESLIN